MRSVTVVLALVAATLASAAPAVAAQGCGLVTKSELHAIFNANVTTTPGETAANCNFLAPKTADVGLYVLPKTRAQFDAMRRNAARGSKVTSVSGLGGPAFWIDPRSSRVVNFDLVILHGRYMMHLDAAGPIPQIGRTRQATHAQVKKLAQIIVRRAAR